MTDSNATNPPETARVIFSAPELLAVRQTLQQIARAHREDAAEVWFDATLIDAHIEAELRYASLDRTRVLTMYAVTSVDVKDAKALMETRAATVEFIGSMFEEWIQEHAHHSPEIDWRNYEYGPRSFKFRGTLVNEKVEADADAFLREHGVDPDSL